MLILRRKCGDPRVIGGSVRLARLKVRGNQVRIGVHRPRDLGVHRAKVLERIQGDAAPEPVTAQVTALTERWPSG